MERLDTVDREEEIKEKKVELFDLGEKRNKCLDKVRELEIKMAEWKQEAEIKREKLMKEESIKIENASNLIQERARTTESDDLEPGNTERDKRYSYKRVMRIHDEMQGAKV